MAKYQPELKCAKTCDELEIANMNKKLIVSMFNIVNYTVRQNILSYIFHSLDPILKIKIQLFSYEYRELLCQVFRVGQMIQDLAGCASSEDPSLNNQESSIV